MKSLDIYNQVKRKSAIELTAKRKIYTIYTMTRKIINSQISKPKTVN